MSNIRTSESDPLRIDVVRVPNTRGQIGMMMLPGRYSSISSFDNVWQRDLRLDLAVIEKLGPALVLTLNESREFASLGVPQFETVLRESPLPWHHLPIPDGGVPDATFERTWETVGPIARAAIADGGIVVIHCRAGLGRTGMLAARLLVEFGTLPDVAIAMVRAARPYTIENAIQENHVRSIRPIEEHEALA